MKKAILSLATALFVAHLAYAQAPAAPASPASPAAPAAASDCEAKAVGKSGKPLTGAAKTSFMKKCEGGGHGDATAACEAKAVSKSGKPLTGAAKTSFMKKCEAEAGK